MNSGKLIDLLSLKLKILAYRAARHAVDTIYYKNDERVCDSYQVSSYNLEQPFNYEVPYRAFLPPAYSLGILSIEHNISALIAGQYINICFPKKKISVQDPTCCRILQPPTVEDYHFLGYLEYINSDVLVKARRTKAILDFLFNSLENNFFIEANVNDYYICGTARYRRYDLRHPLLITGWSSRRNSFDAATYLATGQYNRTPVSAADLIKALYSRGSLDRKTIYNKSMLPYLRSAKPIPLVSPPIRTNAIIEQLKDYLASRKPSFNYLSSISLRKDDGLPPIDHPLNDCIYGIDTLKIFEMYFRNAIKEPNILDMRVGRVLYEHKNMMVMRLSYLEDLNLLDPGLQISQNFGVIRLWAKTLHFQLIQFRECGFRESEALLATLNHVQEIYDLERKLLGATIKYIGN